MSDRTAPVSFYLNLVKAPPEIDIPLYTTIFFVALAISSFIGTFVIRRIYNTCVNNKVDEWQKAVKGKTEETSLHTKELLRKFSALTGSLERAIYIYSILTLQYSLFAGFIVMKAFFTWAEKAKDPQEDSNATLIHYYTYVIGNCLSILFAILSVFIAIYLVTELQYQQALTSIHTMVFAIAKSLEGKTVAYVLGILLSFWGVMRVSTESFLGKTTALVMVGGILFQIMSMISEP